MTSEVKLLTAHDVSLLRARAVDQTSANQIEAFLRERGLIAPEPVDPLLYEARRLVLQDGTTRTVNQIEAIRNGHAGKEKVSLAHAALKRGIELAYRKELTWEEVRDAYLASKGSGTEVGLITRLHAALTDGGRDA